MGPVTTNYVIILTIAIILIFSLKRVKSSKRNVNLKPFEFGGYDAEQSNYQNSFSQTASEKWAVYLILTSSFASILYYFGNRIMSFFYSNYSYDYDFLSNYYFIIGAISNLIMLFAALSVKNLKWRNITVILVSIQILIFIMSRFTN